MPAADIISTLPSVADWYRDRYAVYHKDIDFNQELRLSALLLMLQETAWNHASVIGIDYRQEAFKSIIWVLSRMRVEFLAPAPQWMESVTLATSPTGIDRLFALRDFLALDSQDRPFARVASAWVMIDAQSRRPVRPQSILNEDNFQFSPSVLPEGTAKLKSPLIVDWYPAFTPGYADIDAHQHVNNVSYAQWCLNANPPEFFGNYRLACFDINFLAELGWSDQARVGCLESLSAGAGSEDGIDLWQDCAVQKTADSEMAALVRFGWRRR